MTPQVTVYSIERIERSPACKLMVTVSNSFPANILKKPSNRPTGRTFFDVSYPATANRLMEASAETRVRNSRNRVPTTNYINHLAAH